MVLLREKRMKFFDVFGAVSFMVPSKRMFLQATLFSYFFLNVGTYILLKKNEEFDEVHKL